MSPTDAEREAALTKKIEERLEIKHLLRDALEESGKIRAAQEAQVKTNGANDVAFAEIREWRKGVDNRLDKHSTRIEGAGKKGLLVGAGGSLTGGGILFAIWEFIKAHNGS